MSLLITNKSNVANQIVDTQLNNTVTVARFVEDKYILTRPDFDSNNRNIRSNNH